LIWETSIKSCTSQKDSWGKEGEKGKKEETKKKERRKEKRKKEGRAIAQAVSRWLPTARPGFEPGSVYVGFVDKVTLGQVFYECFGFPFQFSFRRLLHNHHRLSSGAGTIGQLWPKSPRELTISLTPLRIIIKERKKEFNTDPSNIYNSSF
jgi:hypothetical protein